MLGVEWISKVGGRYGIGYLKIWSHWFILFGYEFFVSFGYVTVNSAKLWKNRVFCTLLFLNNFFMNKADLLSLIIVASLFMFLFISILIYNILSGSSTSLSNNFFIFFHWVFIISGKLIFIVRHIVCELVLFLCICSIFNIDYFNVFTAVVKFIRWCGGCVNIAVFRRHFKALALGLLFDIQKEPLDFVLQIVFPFDAALILVAFLVVDAAASVWAGSIVFYRRARGASVAADGPCTAFGEGVGITETQAAGLFGLGMKVWLKGRLTLLLITRWSQMNCVGVWRTLQLNYIINSTSSY